MGLVDTAVRMALKKETVDLVELVASQVVDSAGLVVSQAGVVFQV